MTTSSRTIALSCLALAFGCSQAQGVAPAPSTSTEPASAPSTTTLAASSSTTSPDDSESEPKEKFSNGARAFAAIKDEMMKSYYEEGLSEDDFYRAASEGLLEHIDPAMRKWNKLLGPSDVAELRSDLKGELVGVGTQIDFDSATGYTDVVGTIPGSPAEKAGVLAGDKIVTVDGKLFKGMTIRDVVSVIRGPAGVPVTLSILRADKLLSFTITRATIAYSTVEHFMLPDGVGYLGVASFTSKTAALVKEALEDLAAHGAKALVFDVRESPGGSFDEAIAASGLMLPTGTPIANVKKRGAKDDVYAAKGTPILATIPLAVLVDHGTSSGAELMTAALQEGRHAVVIGTRTYGKWSVQSIEDLDNGYAYKFTTGTFYTPSGKTYGGVGLEPDVEVTMDEKATTRALAVNDPDKRLAIDMVLRTAAAMLRPRP
jgi:carboxyl-terminal processing protease